MKRDDRPVGPGGSWSDAYFRVDRSLLVRARDRAAFDDYATLTGKKIVVTRGSTADIDAQITRNASSGVLDRLNAFIAENEGGYAPAPQAVAGGSRIDGGQELG